MTGINLIPAHRRANQQRRARQRLWLGVGLGYAGALLTLCGFVHVTFHPASATAAEDLETTGTRIVELNTRLADTRKQLSEAESLRQTNVAISDQPDWSILLGILGNSVGEEIVLREIQLHPETGNMQQYSMQIRGYGKTQPEISQFVLRLQQVGLFDDVKLARTSREPIFNVSAVTFEISAQIRPGTKERP